MLCWLIIPHSSLSYLHDGKVLTLCIFFPSNGSRSKAKDLQSAWKYFPFDFYSLWMVNVKNKPFFKPSSQFWDVAMEKRYAGGENGNNKTRRVSDYNTMKATSVWMEICFYFPIEVNFLVIIAIPQIPFFIFRLT